MAEPTSASLAAFFAGRSVDAWRVFGAQPSLRAGFDFRVWAPGALRVQVAGDFDDWRGTDLERDGDCWAGYVAAARAGQRYKLKIEQADGRWVDRTDPFAQITEAQPGTAAVLPAAHSYAWTDSDWLERRAAIDHRAAPISVYEVHPGSWRRHLDGGFYSWRDLADPLVDHVTRLGFTHVELMPIAEFPYAPSWGYQVTGFFAPTARHGSPDDLRYLVDRLHAAGIGVIVDWVPGHFPRDDHALAHFDGTPLFEHPDPRKGAHADWGTLVFDYGRPEVRSFLISSAHYWLTEFHIDGLRVDAVASMIYLDYSRSPGEWVPNFLGTNVHLEAIGFLQELNRSIHAAVPGALTMAEESTSFAGVTGTLPPWHEGGVLDHDAGLGFDFKWNMGWMNDTLRYFGRDPVHRKHHHDEMTFAAWYAFDEAFVLPLSHDEVVHGKGALVRKVGGHWEHGLAQLRALLGWQWLFPGKKLLFQGNEFGQTTEWDFDHELPWAEAAEPIRGGLMRWVTDLNAAYRELPSLHLGDCQRDGFIWVDHEDRDRSILSWLRMGGERDLAVVCSFTPTRHVGFLLHLPGPGPWRVVLDSDRDIYGGFNDKPLGALETIDLGGSPAVRFDLAGYSVMLLERAG